MNRILENTQKMCDSLKWNASQDLRRDLSGDMPYCKYCERHLSNNKCIASQEEREKCYLCAKAYKRMVAKNK